MALSRMVKLGEICNARGTLLPRNSFQPKALRHERSFKRGRNQDPKSQHNLESIESPFQDTSIISTDLSITNLWKPLAFTIGFSAACFTGAAVWQYESMRSHAIRMLKVPTGFFNKKKNEIHIQNEFVKEVVKWWNSLTPGEKVFVPLCMINVIVFGAWRVPKLQPYMLKYFCSNPGTKNSCWPMLLSTFSHYSAFHLFANMYVLHSFSTGAVASLGKEQFLGLYLSAGVISSFTSYVYKTVTKQSGLSLGASGAIMAILGYVCTQYPDTKLGIILLPFLSFSAGTAIKVIVGLDTAGVLLGWKFFDHAAHLGGAVTGIVWALWGNEYLWQKRDPLLQYWHQVRGAIK